jgi:hypothetical protein
VVAADRSEPFHRVVEPARRAWQSAEALVASMKSAADREARTREIQHYSQHLPENSYGRQNRETIAARETRITTRLRAIERAYRTALDPETTPAPELTQVPPARPTGNPTTNWSWNNTRAQGVTRCAALCVAKNRTGRVRPCLTPEARRRTLIAMRTRILLPVGPRMIRRNSILSAA